MKQRILAVLIAGILALQLAGCGNQPEESSSEPEEDVSESSTQEESLPELEPEESGQPEEESEPESSSDMEQSAVPAIEPEADDAPQDEPVTDVVAQTVATADGWKPFALDPQGNYNLYAYHPAFMYYADMGYAAWSNETPSDDPLVRAISAINALAGTPTGTVDPNSMVDGGFLYVAMDGSYDKHQYLLQSGMLVVDSTAYAVTAEQYANLKKIADSSAVQGVRGAQWLVYMNPSRVIRIECTDTDGQMKQMKTENIGIAAMEPRYIDVQSGSTYTLGAINFNGMFVTKFIFDKEGGITYTIAAKGTNLYVESSDMAFGCQYTAGEQAITSFIETMQGMIDGPANPRTGKPVIYLYPEQKQDVEVKLDFQGELGYTFPIYNGGWNVTAQPDGTLTNKADGSTHYYLFWDGNAFRNDWDFSKGFVVKGSEAQSFLLEKLPRLGLTPREYNDFITYWVPELAQNEYNLITFSTTQYEQTAPLHITPAPDTIIRVHMVYKPLEAPVAVKEQTLPAVPARDGFTVVEWGGTRAYHKTK